MPVEMDDFEEKVWKYLVEHKTPVQVKTLARRWIVSDSRVRIVFEKLIAGGVVDVVRIGSSKYYKVKA
jgi:predicted transcriptional regulator